jgi:DNA-binding transcriptional regulator YdaS (Cro superfamily)
MNNGLRAAIAAAGGVRALARLLGITHGAILHWHKVPDRHIVKIEEETGVPREKLRPDLYHTSANVIHPKRVSI